MTDFTASNGIKITKLDDGQLEIVFPGQRPVISWARADEAEALREYFEWPDDPEHEGTW